MATSKSYLCIITLAATRPGGGVTNTSYSMELDVEVGARKIHVMNRMSELALKQAGFDPRFTPYSISFFFMEEATVL